MSAFGGKADMPPCGSPLLRSLLGVKRTWVVAAHMSAYDPKRTLTCFFSHSPPGRKVLGYSHRTKRGPSRSAHATTRFHQSCCRFRSRVADRGARAAGGEAGGRVSQCRVCQGLRATIVGLSQRSERGRLRRWPQRRNRISLGGGPTGPAAGDGG